jgi:predicted extracellular nuclease
MLVSLLPMQPAYAKSPDIVISEVYGGGGNSGGVYTHDIVELFNRGTAAVSLAGWSIQYTSAAGTGNFGSSTTLMTSLSGVLNPGQYLLVQEAAGSNVIAPLPTPDVTDPSPIAMSGTGGKVALVMSDASLGCNGGSTPCSPAQLALIKDLVGWDGANFFEGAGAAPATTNPTATLRNGNGCNDTDNNSVDFITGAPTPRNTASPLSPCVADSAPSITGSFPVDGASNLQLDSNLSVTFSEPVNVTAAAFDLTCSNSGVHIIALSGGPTDFTLNPDVDFSLAETCTLTVSATAVTDQDTDDPPDNMVADYTASFITFGICDLPYTSIYSIQGSGMSAAITGTLTTQGVVVGDFETSASLSGFYLQDANGDDDPATSDGIFVYTGSNNFVSAGDVVRVTGYARERFNQTAINGTDNNSSSVTFANTTICGTASVSPVDVTMPFASIDYPERYEGMLVNFPQALEIAEYFNYDRFGEIVLGLPFEGQSRLYTPTSVVEPGAPAMELSLQNNLRRITLDDVQSAQNPSTLRHSNGDPFSLTNLFRGGDLVQNAVGVLGYDFSLYRIMPTGPADFTAVNPRPAMPDPVGGRLQVAAMNTLNYFRTIDTGALICGPLQNVECRGADTFEEQTRQHDKLVAALSGINTAVIGLIEIENTPGVDPLAYIVNSLNAIPGVGPYAYINTGVIGTDAIRVGMIYQPGLVTPVGEFKLLTTAVDSRFLDNYNRPALAQTFEENSTGERFTMVVNHLKSKGSDCDAIGDPDTLDGQGNCNLTRTAAAQAMVDWLATDPTGSGDPDFIIMGDLNSYAMEDPIDAILAGPDDTLRTADDYANLILQYQGVFAYSYVFDGQNGYLDHALANSHLATQVTGATEWHINADEPDVLDYDMTFKPPAQEALYEPNAYRSSDHDATIVGLNLAPTTDGFMTGGGWINSPASAFLIDPTLTGKGEFSFDAKYVKNSPLPVGAVDYMIEKAGLYFSATGFEWLVVDSGSAWLRGTGMFNGAAGYSFMLTAMGGSDYFRLQIWELASGMLVYDNQRGEAEFAPATTPLGGGKIMIH